MSRCQRTSARTSRLQSRWSWLWSVQASRVKRLSLASSQVDQSFRRHLPCPVGPQQAHLVIFSPPLLATSTPSLPHSLACKLAARSTLEYTNPLKPVSLPLRRLPIGLTSMLFWSCMNLNYDPRHTYAVNLAPLCFMPLHPLSFSQLLHAPHTLKYTSPCSLA